MLDCNGQPALAGTRVPVETLPPEQLRVLGHLGFQLSGLRCYPISPDHGEAPS